MKREYIHTFKQDHARDDTGAETEPAVYEAVVRSDFRSDNLHHYLRKSNKLPLDDEVRKTLVVLWTRKSC